jgi:hypothetical protein
MVTFLQIHYGSPAQCASPLPSLLTLRPKASQPTSFRLPSCPRDSDDSVFDAQLPWKKIPSAAACSCFPLRNHQIRSDSSALLKRKQSGRWPTSFPCFCSWPTRQLGLRPVTPSLSRACKGLSTLRTSPDPAPQAASLRTVKPRTACGSGAKQSKGFSPSRSSRLVVPPAHHLSPHEEISKREISLTNIMQEKCGGYGLLHLRSIDRIGCIHEQSIRD